MILREIADTLIRSVSGGTDPAGNKYDPEYVEALVPQLREQAIRMDYNGGRNMAAHKRVDYGWISKPFKVTKDDGIQVDNADFILFSVPKPCVINKSVDGFIYVGKELDAVSFTKLNSRAEVALYKTRGFLRNGKDIAYIWEYPYLTIFGNNALQEVYVSMVASNPLDVPGFDVEADEYPVTESLLPIMTDLFKQQMNININRASDTVNDSTDTLARPQIIQGTKI